MRREGGQIGDRPLLPPMSHVPPPGVTAVLNQLRAESPDALDRLLPVVYAELRRIAAQRVNGHRLTIGPTSLVHEAWLKLSQAEHLQADSRAHFLAIAAMAMRQIIVDRARSRLAEKRGAGHDAVSLTDESAVSESRAEEAIALDDALDRLNALEPRLRRVVECRFFGGLTEEETAEAVGVTSRTVRSDWVKARALLAEWLRP